jgi:hypothetical protein
MSGAADTRAGDRDGPGALPASLGGGGWPSGLLPAHLQPTGVAAVVLSPVTVATDPENLATAAATTNSLTEDNFAVGRHPRPKVGLDNGDRSWQLETILVSGYLMKVCHTGNSTALTVGFPSPTGGDQATR